MIGKEVQYRGRFLKSPHLKDLFCKQIVIEKNKKTAPEIVRFQGLWSEMGDSNSRHLAPKASALPTALIPDLGFEFCARCGQTCGQADFLTTSACGESACIAGVSMDCEDSVFRLEGEATRSQIKRDTNFATPGYSLSCHDTTARGKNKFFSVCGHSCGQSRFCAVFGNRGKTRYRPCCKALRRFALPRPG